MGEPLKLNTDFAEVTFRKVMHAKTRTYIAWMVTVLVAVLLIGAILFDLIFNTGNWPTTAGLWIVAGPIVGILIPYYFPLKADDP